MIGRVFERTYSVEYHQLKNNNNSRTIIISTEMLAKINLGTDPASPSLILSNRPKMTKRTEALRRLQNESLFVFNSPCYFITQTLSLSVVKLHGTNKNVNLRYFSQPFGLTVGLRDGLAVHKDTFLYPYLTNPPISGNALLEILAHFRPNSR